jgi:hypothetical protein
MCSYFYSYHWPDLDLALPKNPEGAEIKKYRGRWRFLSILFSSTDFMETDLVPKIIITFSKK